MRWLRAVFWNMPPYAHRCFRLRRVQKKRSMPPSAHQNYRASANCLEKSRYSSIQQPQFQRECCSLSRFINNRGTADKRSLKADRSLSVLMSHTGLSYPANQTTTLTIRGQGLFRFSPVIQEGIPCLHWFLMPVVLPSIPRRVPPNWLPA